MNIFTNSILTLKFVTKVFAVNRENGAYHSYIKKVASYEIRKSHDLNDGSISRLDFLKIQWYMVTTLYLGELIAELRPNKLTEQEKMSLIYSGALMAITDLMVDDHQLGSEKLIALLSGEAFDHEDLSPVENVFILYHNKLVSIISKKKVQTIQNFSLRKPHIESQSQLITDLTEDEVIAYCKENMTPYKVPKQVEFRKELPKSNVLQFLLEDGSKISVRPSGTEPKIKFYFSVSDKLDEIEDYGLVKAGLDEKIQGIKKEMKLI